MKVAVPMEKMRTKIWDLNDYDCTCAWKMENGIWESAFGKVHWEAYTISR